MLGAMGCTSLQGFLYARPIDAEAVTAWLQARLVAGGRTETSDWVL
jgi:EAL domain-containing protein (putative c-di-GMP-specific phosphodiesterase class I)